MSKPLAGKRAFEAMGRRAQSMGFPLIHKRLERTGWPLWARAAWARGWIYNFSKRALSERLAEKIMERGGPAAFAKELEQGMEQS